jgi:AraC family transcriptional regulator
MPGEIPMNQAAIELSPPRLAEHPAIVVAGLAHRYDQRTKSQIAALWQRFGPSYMGKIPGQVGSTSYGVCYNYGSDGSFDYLCAVQVNGSPSLPVELTAAEIPATRYAVFSHTEHISTIGLTWMAIFSEWLPASGCTLKGEPNFEVYTDLFDPLSGTGLVEIWIPLKEETEV